MCFRTRLCTILEYLCDTSPTLGQLLLLYNIVTFSACCYCSTVRHSWQKLGTELSKLADLHSQKATAYLDAVRHPLQELLPQLEETRQEVRPVSHTIVQVTPYTSSLALKRIPQDVNLTRRCLRERGEVWSAMDWHVGIWLAL